MAYRVRAIFDIDWVPDGGGNTFLGQFQGNNPGQGGAEIPMSVGMAQTRRYTVGEGVPGGDAPTLANFLTALTACANDMAASSGTVLITAGELAILQGWASGGV